MNFPKTIKSEIISSKAKRHRTQQGGTKRKKLELPTDGDPGAPSKYNPDR